MNKIFVKEIQEQELTNIMWFLNSNRLLPTKMFGTDKFVYHLLLTHADWYVIVEDEIKNISIYYFLYLHSSYSRDDILEELGKLRVKVGDNSDVRVENEMLEYITKITSYIIEEQQAQTGILIT